jgi:hypothetical protein
VTRESDGILAADLRAAGLDELASLAELSEWNDYFGESAMPQMELIAAINAQDHVSPAVRKELVENVMDGKYDGTKAESDEWARSPEGRATFDQLSPALRAMFVGDDGRAPGSSFYRPGGGQNEGQQ